MVKIDLITGFLGSGKTTFIRQYARHLIDSGKRIAIVENDFGAINVDMMLLADLEGPNCELEMVVGGEDYDCHKRRFRTKLINLGMMGFDRVLVEPSGIYDVDEFFDVLHEAPLDQWYEIGSIISIIDARLEIKLSRESDYVLTSEIADAGVVVLSKTQLAKDGEIKATVAHMNDALAAFHCDREFVLGRDVLASSWEDWNDEDYQKIEAAGVSLHDHLKLPIFGNGSFETVFYMNQSYPEEELRDKIGALMADPSCGNVMRIKGFMKREDGSWYEANATRNRIDTVPIEKGQKVLIVIGEKLNRQQLNRYLGVDPLTAQRTEEIKE